MILCGGWFVRRVRAGLRLKISVTKLVNTCGYYRLATSVLLFKEPYPTIMGLQHRPGRGASSPAMPVAGFLQPPFFVW